MVLPFDQIYVISLKKSTNRRKHLFEEFNRIGGITDSSDCGPVIVDANNGCKYSHHVDNSTKRINRKQNISQGEIGCFASHRAVWIQFLESDAETCLIMEDDVRFGMNFEHLIDNYDQLPEFDYLNLGYITNNKSIKNEFTRILPDKFDLLHSGCGMWLTHAYVVNRKAAQVFLDGTQVQTGGIDWQLTGLQDRIKSIGFQGNHVATQAKTTLCNPSLIKHTQ